MDDVDRQDDLPQEPDESVTGAGAETPAEPETGTVATPAREVVRDLIVRAYPDVVPELIQGGTLEEMLATLPEAQEAYQRVAEAVGTPGPDPVPAGGGIRSPEIDAAQLSPEMKIREALRATKGNARHVPHTG